MIPPEVAAQLEPAWAAAQARLAALVPNARYVLAAESGHFIQLEQPRLVIDAIREVVAAVREPSSWSGTLGQLPTGYKHRSNSSLSPHPQG